MGRIKSATVQMVLTAGLLASLIGFAMVHYAPPVQANLLDPIENRDVAGVKDALAHNADVNQVDAYGAQPLQLAICQGDIEIVRLLIDAGASLRHVDDSHVDALSQAAMCDKPEILKLLLDHGAPLENPARGHNVLGTAAVMDPELVKILLAAGADPNEHMVGQRSPLQYAIDAESPEAAQLLLAAGAKPIATPQAEAVATRERSNDRIAHRMPRSLLHELRVMNGMRRPFTPQRPFIASSGVAKIFPPPRPRAS